jgi:UDP-GlcNAc3NAcA epimerase
MLEYVENVLLTEKPDVVLVYCDTNSTLAGALVASKLHISVAHVEAGLRSFNIAMPEEFNRTLTDRVSHCLLTPTHAATQHLEREGVAPAAIEEVGDVMYDVALQHGQRVNTTGRVLQQLALAPGAYVLATVHRVENTDHPARLQAILDGLEAVAQQLPVVWPMHPRTRGVLHSMGRLATLSPQLRLLDPVGYLDMVQLEKHAAVIATDSGGVQKEAFFYRVPCVTLREETEWVELVDVGWNRLVTPLSADAIESAVAAAIDSTSKTLEPYGSGNAAQKIVNALKD